MGTNFYLVSKSKKLIRENFAVEKDYGYTEEEYGIVDEPYLGYRVHLNKLSCGWRPLFQRHKNIRTFKELEDFCLKIKMLLVFMMNMVRSTPGSNIITGYIVIVSENRNPLSGFMK